MFKFITNKISNKIIISLFVLMSISSLFVTYISTLQVKVDSIAETKKNLVMLNTAMFQSLRNAMNTGIPETIKKAGDDARAIDGVKRLVIARSKPHLEMYDPQGEFTKDPDVLKSFETKENQLLETNDENGHNLRMIKPMIAEQECLMCHANQKKGDIIGIMDLTFSLEESDAKINNLVVEMLVISTIFGWITIGLIFFIVKRATKPIATLKNGFEDLLNSNDPSIKLNVESKDEIGEVAQLFNSYMDKVRAGLKQDEKVIEEANDILEKTGNGFFVYQVKSNASNPYVEDLKNKLNSMIIHTKDTLDKINLTLKNYSESKFDYKIDDNGIYGDLGSLTAGIKLVGNNTSEILAMIMNTGDSLNENTHTLSTASNQLSQSSNRQAASLEETAAALEQITANIKGNTEASIEMSTLANKVTKSAQSGHELANQTTTAMDDINTQVTSINEAIDVIDQIAFQTNILSLNAAVEAATAGEAGKGFAVVAQEVRNLASRSAEAAKEIKDLVEKATHKANQGKQISDTMITGYEELNENIKSTIEKIEQVSNASKEQEAGIVQINDAVNLLDKATQENAQIAEQISTMSKNIANMSNSLVTAASRASFLQEARQEVCNVDLVYDTAKLKVHVLGLKDDVYSKLGSYEKWTTSSCSTVSAWIEDYLEVNPNCDNNAVKELEELNMSLKVKLQELVDANANKENTQILNEKAKAVEIESLRIFGTLNKLKKEACKGNK